MKVITYRGGVVTFTVPENWVEQYEKDGGGMFYEDAPNTGTLRLNLVTLKSPKLLSPNDAYENLASMKSINTNSVQRMGNGNAIATSIQHSTEQGKKITLYWWYIANPIFPDIMRIANCSYTILTSQENDPLIKKEIKLLTESIKNAKFHSTIGQ